MQRPRRFASPVVPPWASNAVAHPDGRPGVCLLGWILVVAAAGALAWLLTPQVAATVGTGWLTYNSQATASAAPGWLAVVFGFGSLLGFNLVYWFAAPAARVRHLAGVLAVLGAELLGLIGCVVWVTGAGYPAGAVFSLTATDGSAAVGATALLGLVSCACGIMLWLGASTTFDQQRDEYFYGGTTTVTADGISIRAHLRWLLGLLLVWTLLLVMMIASLTRKDDGYRAISGATTDLAWPREYSYVDTLSGALLAYATAFAALWSVSLSFLIEKVLYRGPWAARAELSQRKRTTSRFARFLVKFRHWPITAGGTLATLTVFAQVGPDDSHRPLVVIAVVLAVAGLGAGLLFFRWEWKVRNLYSSKLRLRLATAPSFTR